MDDLDFLILIHRTAALEVGALPRAMGLPQSRAMVPALQKQLRESRSVAAQAQAYAKERGSRLRGPGTAALALAGAGLWVQARLDPSTSGLAERILRENTGNTVQIARRLHQCTAQTDPALAAMARRLLAAEEENIREMRRFL